MAGLSGSGTDARGGVWLLKVGAVHQFEWIDGIHVSAFVGLRCQEFDPLHDQCIQQQDRKGKNNQPKILSNHPAYPFRATIRWEYTRKCYRQELRKDKFFGGIPAKKSASPCRSAPFNQQSLMAISSCHIFRTYVFMVRASLLIFIFMK